MALKSKAMRKGGRKVRKTLKNKKYKRGGSVENTPGAKPVQHNSLMHGISSGFKGIGNMMGFKKPHEESQPGAPHPGAPHPGAPQPVPPQQGGRKVKKSKAGKRNTKRKTKRKYSKAKKSRKN